MAKSDKLPALQFYPGDWRKDPGVQALDYFCRGVWFEILCLMHESDDRGKLLLNGRPMPDEALARTLGLDNQILTTTLTTLLTYGVASRDPETGALISRRMIRDESIRRIRTECGKMGGNPNLVNQKSTTKVNQIPTPSSSSSSSSSSSDQDQREDPATPRGPTPMEGQGESEEAGGEGKPPKTFPKDSLPYRASDYFGRTYLPRVVPSAKPVNEAWVQKQAGIVDLMLRIDERTEDQIKHAYRRLLAQEPDGDKGFLWRKNILSLGTLRKRWNEGKLDSLLNGKER